MTQLNVKTLCENITNTLRQVATLTDVMNANEIKDTIPPDDMPLLMVYPQTTETDAGTATQMTTFRGGVQQEDLTVNCDVYIAPIGGPPVQEVMEQLIELWDALNVILRAQVEKPYFGDAQIQSFQYDITRVELNYSDYRYYGLQIVLYIREF